MEELDKFSHITPAMWLKQETELLKFLDSYWDEVPLVNISDAHKLPDHKLVKFRGMVYDNLNIEVFLQTYEVRDKVTNERTIRSMKFFDELRYDEKCEDFCSGSPNNVYMHRQIYLGSPIPGLNHWAHSIEQNCGPSIESSRTLKRSIEDVEMTVDESNSTSGTKKQCTSKTPTYQNIVLRTEPLENPNLEKTCFLLFYDETKILEITDLVEAVGFISHTEAPIIRIHCVTFKKIDHCNLLSYGNRLLDCKYPLHKNDLHLALSRLLLGDKLAAEYLIYHLISRIYTRKDVFPIGKFCLNISQVPPSILDEFGKNVYEFIEQIVPASQFVPLTIESINTLRFMPKKDYETDMMITGVLQVAPSTHIVLDETKLEAGQLNETGFQTMKMLTNVIVHQKVPYDCLNYAIDLDCDIPVLTISEGKSLLPNDHRVCLQPDETCLSIYPEILTAGKRALQAIINEIRLYLTQARHRDLQFSDEVMQVIQNDFVQLRQTRFFGADDLHRLLVLSRLIAISDGKTVLDIGSWQKACELDQIRASRIEFYPV